VILITGLKAYPSQTFSMVDPAGGGTIYFTINYRPRVQGWFLDVTFNAFTLAGLKLVRSPNVLAQYHNRIPFGLMVAVSDGFEPFLVNDFYTSRVALYLLDALDVLTVEASILDGTIV
jgi:hypothetical protein